VELIPSGQPAAIATSDGFLVLFLLNNILQDSSLQAYQNILSEDITTLYLYLNLSGSIFV
jgi:hypothetical protein